MLLLGSGLVAGPAVDVFAARPDVHLIIGKPFPFSIGRSMLIYSHSQQQSCGGSESHSWPS